MRAKGGVSAVIIPVVLLFAGSCCEPEPSGSVRGETYPQETTNWGWAAVTQMLAAHAGVAVKQCDLANRRFGMTGCCELQHPGNDCLKSNNCNMPGWPELGFAGLRSAETAAPLPWDSLRSRIYCSGDPLGYAYGTRGAVGQTSVIRGYVALGTRRYVILTDPGPLCAGADRLVTYEQYADPPGSAIHWVTWYDIAEK